MIIDLLVLVMMAYFVFQGLRKGLIRMLVDTAAVIGGAFFAWQMSPDLAVYLGPIFPIEMASMIPSLSFLVLWAALFLGVVTIGSFLEKLFCPLVLKPINMVAGALFGGFKGAIYMIPVIICLGTWGATKGLGTKVVTPVYKFLESRDITADYMTDLIEEISDGKPLRSSVRRIKKMNMQLLPDSLEDRMSDTFESRMDGSEDVLSVLKD